MAMCYYLGKGGSKSLCMAHAHKQKWFKISKNKLGKTDCKQPADGGKSWEISTICLLLHHK